MADGTHDSFVAAALSRLDDEQHRRRFLAEAAQWLATLRELFEHRRRGVGISPGHRRPVVDQLAAEGERRCLIGDPTAAAWTALAESTRLECATRELEP